MRFRVPELFLGSLLTIAVFSIGLTVSSHHLNQKARPLHQEAYGKNERAGSGDSDLVGSAWLTRDAAGFFTFVLVVVGGLQAILFLVQLRLMRESLVPAKEAANAAAAAAQHIPVTERAYLFIGLELGTDFDQFFQLHPLSGRKDRARVTFGFSNYGKTPAIVTELHTTASYWPIEAGWPAMALATKSKIQAGFVIGAEPAGGYSVDFRLTKDAFDKAEEGSGYILFWGKVTYLDVFQTTHETGWCRAYKPRLRDWRFAGDDTLNYFN